MNREEDNENGSKGIEFVSILFSFSIENKKKIME